MTKIIASNIDEFIAQQNDPVWRNSTIDKVFQEIDRVRAQWPRERWKDIGTVYEDRTDEYRRNEPVRARQKYMLRTYEEWLEDCREFDGSLQERGKPPLRDIRGVLWFNNPTIRIFEDCFDELHKAAISRNLAGIPLAFIPEKSNDENWYNSNGDLHTLSLNRFKLDTELKIHYIERLRSQGVYVPACLKSPEEITGTMICTPSMWSWKPFEGILSYLKNARPEKSFFLAGCGKSGPTISTYQMTE